MYRWTFDPAHCEVGFSARHMMFTRVRGTFSRWSGAIVADENGVIAAISAEIEVDSLSTHEAERDAHLRSPDFFDAASHPLMTFRSNRVRGDTSATFKVSGELTIRGTTRPVTLDVECTGGGVDVRGSTRRGYRARTSVNRHDFGLRWNQALELGGVLVSEQVDVEIEAQLIRHG